MKALVLASAGKLEIQDMPKPVLASGQVLIKIKSATLNRRDQWIREGKYPDIKFGVILGSDGCGIVEEVFDEVNRPWVGKEVVINPNNDWGDDPEVQSGRYSILGMPVHGTFAEYIAVNADRIQLKPAHLDHRQAASLPLGGLTSYRALFRKGELQAGQNVLISGFGGGVAQLAFLFALAAGANVYVNTSSKEKLEKAIKLGAKGGYNYKKENTFRDLWKTKGGFDLILDSSGGDSINAFIKILKPSGKLVFYGASNGLPSGLDLHRMFWKQLSLKGSTMGNDEEFVHMLQFVSKHKILPLVDSIRPFDKIISGFDHIGATKRVGKIVVEMG
jgi:NADPH:quinone reductase-like Zn-dependent oxidoreductase